MNDLIEKADKTRVQFPTAPQNMKSIIKKFLTFIGFIRKLKSTKIVTVYNKQERLSKLILKKPATHKPNIIENNFITSGDLKNFSN